ncbi:Bifunctional NAD(P)H-hydrate repair enzyme Nnr [Candidatus Izimaplasma bacterium HR1]|jgi:NAD(P)H-hydrate epimerase|uniref:bifunctional ADP-dependent NAD(P)H-hydrate dehydratase/NAD(P)H-hydrate epimerase n=1 Tax=Candidatus Izimoplasma sp. HR1 TaxID=1541959 RepID=UPI0004F6B53D|nr:Bifunctional NAD(P)H-hydrate repair enzyme Nnr [Candidatus Izimaplasma bacterium HR1]
MRDLQIVSAQEMRLLDKLTLKEKEMTSYELMNHAGRSISNYLMINDMFSSTDSILVIAGTGNNGGDALVIALSLLEQNIIPNVIIVGNLENESVENQEALETLKVKTTAITYVSSEEDIDAFTSLVDTATIIIDGIFGIGLSSDVRDYYSKVITIINRSYAQVISIDLPSGINADNGLVMKAAVKADHTIVIQNYKQGNLLNDALDYSGQLHLLDIGILQTLYEEPQVLLHKSYLKNKLNKRVKNSHKYHFGNILTIGGSKGMMGAPLLAGISALYTGSGLSAVSYNEKYLHHIHNIYPEVMVNTYIGIEDIPSQVRKRSAVIFGPGLGQNDEVNLDVLNYLLSLDIPLIIDADGIFYLKQLLKEYSTRKNIIITPHNQEMATFLGIDIEDVKQEPVLFAKNIAHTYNLTVVLKGVCTIITNNEESYFSIHGNPGMATAGTGDVLSGIIASLLGRGYSPLEAAKIGVLIHSKAGELASHKYGEESMTATDVIKNIYKVIRDAKS